MAKSAFAVAIFSITVGGYCYFTDDLRLRRHLPLPHGGVENPACTLWFVGSSSVNKWKSLQTDMATWPVHNRGVNGALLDELDHRFTLDRDRAAPAAVVVYAGENDIAHGATADQAVAQMTHFLDTVRARLPRTPLFVIDLKPSPTRWAMRPDQLRYNATIKATLAGHPRTRLIEIGDDLLVGGRPGPFYVEDGVHLNDAGYTRWGGDIRRGLEAAMPAATVAQCGSRGR